VARCGQDRLHPPQHAALFLSGELTFPNTHHTPAGFVQRPRHQPIPRNIPFELRQPKFAPRFRLITEPASLVPVPEAPVLEYGKTLMEIQNYVCQLESIKERSLRPTRSVAMLLAGRLPLGNLAAFRTPLVQLQRIVLAGANLMLNAEDGFA